MSRAARRPIAAKVLGFGAAGAAAALAVAPLAAAQAPGHVSSHAPVDPQSHASQGGAHVPRPNVGVSPQFGWQKFRVGVQIKSGAYVPPDTSTLGSKVQLIETDHSGAVVNKQTCTTSVPDEEGSTETYCTFDQQFPPLARGRSAKAPAAAAGTDDYYYAAPGDTVQLVQTKVEPHLLMDKHELVVNPGGDPGCGSGSYPPNCAQDAGTQTFTDPGLPPVAVDDAATTVSPKPVDIDVLANDDTKGAPESISLTSKPGHGSAHVITSGEGQGAAHGTAHNVAAGDSTIQYTPKDRFVGQDKFHYRLTTANGSSNATVRVTVTAPPPTAHDDSARTDSGVAVTIAVLKNDNAHGGGPLRVKSVGAAGHGTTKVRGHHVVYTPNDRFVGTDTFTYVAATRYGSDTATVTVDVAAPAPSASSSPASASVTPSRSDEPLASTGTPTGSLTVIGIGLVVVGGAATTLGVRRRRGRHA